MSRIFYEQYNHDCYDKEEIIKSMGEIFLKVKIWAIQTGLQNGWLTKQN